MDKRQRENYKAWIGYINSDSRIWGQYTDMVDFVYKEYPKTKQKFEVIAIPLLFTMSHAIELGLKENIMHLKKYSQSKLLTAFNDWMILVKSHNLKGLSKEFNSQFNKTCKKLGVENDIKAGFNKLYGELEKIIVVLEKGTETYRYANKLDNKSEFVEKSLEFEKKIDFYELEKLFTEVDKLLTRTTNLISEYTDYVDLVEAHPQYKIGYKNRLLCRALYVGGGTDLKIRKKFDKEMIRQEDDKWFDKDQGESIEMVIHDDHVYLLLKK
ncbi:hypothetical protein [Haliscomenobacter hydrossis]|uniref:Uncharacterized protein n=1 Tax=Haliscomenobacter hydrossis (strain ATCC 27775 / DSM 1100 / LMG 10767 / O) TaxID=760192 RepID=F4KPB8_HALH1|nr:hypothetical protein [Haliscomenobacter hydrossis]AEE48912.1 hypothetical protein Halhy_1013 [Haliscomenobacter hydrossis DSM 1100]